MLESVYQGRLIKKIQKILPDPTILKNDSGYQQGIPDLSIFCMDWWAWLEVKTSWDAPEEPNQRWFVDWANDRTFGAFIYPENEKEVLHDLQRAFATREPTLLSQPQ